MDPVTVIVQALTLGAAEAVKDTASSAIKDAYQSLHGLLLEKFQKDSKGGMVLEEHKKEPETWKKPLEELLRESSADEDQDVLAAARKLLALLSSDESGSKYDIDVNGNVQMVAGDHATVTMNFSEGTSKTRRNKKKA